MGKSPKPSLETLSRFRVEPLAAVVTGEILDQYVVDQAAVYIIDQDGVGRYVIVEPNLSEDEKHLYSLLMESLNFSLKPVTHIDDPLRYVESYIWEAAEDIGVTEQVEQSYSKYKYFIAKEVAGYGIIDALMNDKDVEEISCEGFNTPVAVIHRRFTNFELLDTNIRFRSEDELRSFVQRLAQKTGKSATTAVPYSDSMSREGHRVAVTYSDEISLPGSTFSIRKFPMEPFSIAHLIKFKTITPLMAAYHWMLVENRGFTLVIGPFGSGKTTILNTFSTMIKPNVKVGSVEDTPELKIPHAHWLHLYTRQSYSITGPTYDIDMMSLVKISMHHRPEYFIVGEVRGEEVRALIQAAGMGHGCLSSLHAESPEAALIRMSSPPMNVSLGGQMLIWNLLMMNRVRARRGDMVRRAVTSTELTPKEGALELKRIFEWLPSEDEFTPEDPETVVKKSTRLKHAMAMRGVSEEETITELTARAGFLSNLVEDGKLTYPEVVEAIRRYYINNAMPDKLPTEPVEQRELDNA